MSLDGLPDDILRQLVYYLSPSDTLDSFRLLSRRTAQLATEPLLWRHHCVNTFKYWQPKHDISLKRRRPVPEVDWKDLFLLRRGQNARISRLFEEILVSKVRRWRKVEEICDLGYDAKDFILAQCHVDDSAEDVLSRRYFARVVLDSIHRSLAIEQWQQLVAKPSIPPGTQVERALGSFDLFVLGKSTGDLDDISRMLDELATEFLADVPDLEEYTTRQKALELNRWVRRKGLTGLQDPEKNYRDLRNCLIGQALRHSEHESIPLISSAIYSSIAQRIGLVAGCCAFPTHVHAMVLSSPGQTLDEQVQEDSDKTETMYLDPYGKDEEIPESTLRSTLSQFGWQPNTGAALSMMTSAAMVIRTAHNINETYNIFRDRDQTRVTPELTQLIDGYGPADMVASYYAHLWAWLLLHNPNTFEWDGQFRRLLDRCSRIWPEDVWLVERYLLPLHDSGVARFQERRGRGFVLVDERQNARQVIDKVRRSDELPPAVFRRSDQGNENVAFRIGDVFRHRRYSWLGIITGWTDRSPLTAESSRRRGFGEEILDTEVINRLRFDDKNYFTYIRAHTAERYVVSDAGVEIISDPREVEENPFMFAGKYFKRFDPETCRFVSNNREQYPED